MNSIGGVLARIPLFKLYRRFGWPQLVPLNLTLSPSPKCNSRCLTCNIWIKREDELSIDEWGKVLASLGRAPYWFTVSGGEPLMYPHVVELVRLAYEHCRPGVISIPTNGILSSIPERVERIASSCPRSQIIINLSLDGLGADHDFIRGIEGNFEKFETRLRQLLDLRGRLRNLTVGIHSVVSRFNIDKVDDLIAYAERSGADQFITEVAEQRIELDTANLQITPSAGEYAKAADRIIAYAKGKRFTGMARFTEGLRIEYYKLAKRILAEKDQVIDCYAGWASAQIYADGTVWPCCVRADNLGSLREHNYDFKKIWFGEKIKQVRSSIAAKECHCPLANASYTNMLHDIPTLARVSGNIIGLRTRHDDASAVTRESKISDQTELAHKASADAHGERQMESSTTDWLDRLVRGRDKPSNYAESALAAYSLGVKAKGSIVGVVAEPGPDCCEAARRLPADRVYQPAEAPRLPLADCPQGHHCDCVYRPAMSYQSVDT